MPVNDVVQKLQFLQWNLYKSIVFEWSQSVGWTELGTKVSFGGVLDSSSDLGEVNE